MKITIIGLTGFVGTNLKKYLNSHKIEGLSIRYIPNQKIEFNADVIIHLAGKAHDLKKISQSNDYYEANYGLTKQVFDSFLISEASVFIFMSTVKAVADEVEGVLTEEIKPNPKTHYGISKQQAEEYILSKELPKGKRVYILRPCMIHGPDNKGNLNLLYQLVAKGFPWPLGAFKNQRSFLSIENLCFVIKQLLEQPNIPSGIYNVADDDFISTNELILILGESLGKKVRVLKISVEFIEIIALLGNYLKFSLNKEKLQKLTESYMVDNKKIRSVIGKPFPVSTREGLRITFKFFKQNKTTY